jgi:exopolyphosphatase/guanosine-5'-triphosphate,3'-diphosphate pyrophosphatase
VRVAAIDLGTNTTRLLVADIVDGNVHEVHRETRITRLGEGVDARKRLLPVAIARVRNALSDYRRTIESLGAERTLLVATSAVRDAENGEAFLGEIEWSYGFATRLVPGDEEAELTRRGVHPPPGTLVLDIGGGSTELLLDDKHVSLDMGSVRFTERFVRTDPPTRDEIDACARAAHALLEPLDMAPQQAIGVAGSVTTLAALEPERAPVIVAGAVILVETLVHFGLDAIEVSERDILDGIALAAAALPAPEEGAAPPGAYTCC